MDIREPYTKFIILDMNVKSEFNFLISMYFFKTCWPKISQLFDFEESYLLGLGPLGSHGSSHVFVAASPPFWSPLLAN